MRISTIVTTAAALLALSTAAFAAPPPLDGAIARKLDARLLSAALGAPSEPVTAWVTFADKGERGGADLSRRLAAAERGLSPRNRARRVRAGLQPLVDVLDLPVDPDYLAQLKAAGLQPFAVSRWFNRAAVRLPAGELGRAAQFGFVSRLEPVERAYVMRDAPDPPEAELRIGLRNAMTGAQQTSSYSYGVSLTQMQQINMVAVHDSGYIGTGVLVCMLDDGFYDQKLHEATSTIQIPPGFRRDFVDGDTVMTDNAANHHGFWTLSCVGANKQGAMLGTAFGATFALARTEDDPTEKPIEMLNWASGAEWADSLGADVISSSLGYFTFPDQPGNDYTYADMNGHTTVVTRAAEIAASKGILVCNSAGNEGASTWHYIIAPADADGDSVLAVGAVTSGGAVAAFSSRGPSSDGRIKPDVCALGSGTSMAEYTGTNTYAQHSGTSFSCPLTAGVAACILSARPSWPATLVIRAMRETASKYATPDNNFGYGILNGLAVLQWSPAWLAAPEGPGASFGIQLLGANPVASGGAGTRVRFSLGAAEAASGSVRVLDVSGRTVRTLWSGSLESSRALEVDWDGRDGAGHPVLPGVYWVALHAGSRLATLKLVTL